VTGDRLPATLAAIAAMAPLVDNVDEAITALVAQARAEGFSWDAIGMMLNLTRQGAHARYAHRVAGVEDVPTP
jgi:hypothetical protein